MAAELEQVLQELEAEEQRRAQVQLEAIQAEEQRRAQRKEEDKAFEDSRRNLERSFAAFAREAWNVLEPATPLSDRPYVDAIAEHMQAMRDRKITRMIVNQPPRTGKSLIISVMFPCWVWATQPAKRFCFFSYSYSLSVGFNIARRRLIQSDWYQAKWGHLFQLSIDENKQEFFSNTATGHMSVLTGATGKGGNFLIIDDPHSVEEAISDTERESGVTKVREGLMSRLDQPHQDCVCIVMQRLHDRDVAGVFLRDGAWQHLCLQAEAEKEISVNLPISEKQWLRPVGDLLDPLRLSKKVLEGKKVELGTRGYFGQYQQEPAPPGGTIFQSTWWRWWKTLPELEQVVVSVDCAFKGKETSDDVAIHAWGMAGINSYLLARDTHKMGFAATKAAIRAMVKDRNAATVLIEDKANGPAIIDELKTEFFVVAIDPGFGDKVARAEGCSPMVEAGTVYLPESADADGKQGTGVKIQTLATKFPNAEKDDIDALTQFLNWRRKRGGSMEWFKAAAKKAQEETNTPAEDKRIEHPTQQEVHRLANEAAGMKTVKPKFTKQVKVEDLRKDTKPQACTECGSTALSHSSSGSRCNSCRHIMPAPSREKNIG